MGRWVDGMAYDDGGACMMGEYDGISVVIPAREVRMREVEEAHLEYLRAFWHYMTADLTLTKLRQVNDHIECDLGTPTPEKYNI